MRNWCRRCGAKIAPEDEQLMAGLPYHRYCAEAEMDYMDRAEAHFRAQQHVLPAAVAKE